MYTPGNNCRLCAAKKAISLWRSIFCCRLLIVLVWRPSSRVWMRSQLSKYNVLQNGSVLTCWLNTFISDQSESPWRWALWTGDLDERKNSIHMELETSICQWLWYCTLQWLRLEWLSDGQDEEGIVVGLLDDRQDLFPSPCCGSQWQPRGGKGEVEETTKWSNKYQRWKTQNLGINCRRTKRRKGRK